MGTRSSAFPGKQTRFLHFQLRGFVLQQVNSVRFREFLLWIFLLLLSVQFLNQIPSIARENGEKKIREAPHLMKGQQHKIPPKSSLYKHRHSRHGLR